MAGLRWPKLGQLGDAVIESGQLGKEPVKFLLDWRPPGGGQSQPLWPSTSHAETLAHSVPEAPIFGVCLGTYSTEAPLDRSVDDFVCSRILSALITDQAVALLAKSINLGLHPHQQFIGGLGCNARCAGDLKYLSGAARFGGALCSISARMKLRAGMVCPAKCVSDQ